MSKNTYDELGRLITKGVGGTDITGATCLQKVDYAYNIRGWLKEINKTGGDPTVNPTPLNIPGEPNDLFAFKINYQDNNKTPTYPGENLVEPLYNGNISETFWRTSSDNVNRKYGYMYDDLNRLKSAVYEKPYTTSPVTNMYNESLSYDKNGNIMSLQRNGDFDAQSGHIPIDNLEYNYFANSNRLRWVKETSTNNGTLGFKDGSNLNTNDGDTTQFDYDYDANGNMITDRNKGINAASATPIKYNHLNLPTEIIFTTTPTVKKITYLYTSTGEKVQKTVTSGTSVSTTDYLDGYQYKGAILQYFPHAEGYVNFDSGVYKHVFNHTDHLGNVRVSYTKDDTTGQAVIMEQNHYYPFGLKHTNYNVNVMKLRGNTVEPTLVNPNKYRFNGKEYQEELGLNYYDYGNRNYDASIGRFFNQDRFSEKYSHITPYQYAANNPILYNDIKGDSIFIHSKSGVNVQYHEGNFYRKNPDTNKNELYEYDSNKKNNKYIISVLNALEKIKRGGENGNSLVTILQNSTKPILIREKPENGANAIAGLVYWNDSNYDSNGNNRPSYIGLAHELGHAYDGLDGYKNEEKIGQIGEYKIEYAEYEAMTWENLIRDENDLELREYYGIDDDGNEVGDMRDRNKDRENRREHSDDDWEESHQSPRYF